LDIVAVSSGGGLPRHTVTEKRLCITVTEAAAMLGLSRNFAYELVRREELPAVRFGKRLLIPRVALEKILEKYLVKDEFVGHKFSFGGILQKSFLLLLQSGASVSCLHGYY